MTDVAAGVLDLETVLADFLAEADTLDRNGAPFSVDRARELVADVKKATEEFRTWLSEGDAAIRAGRSEDWIHARYEQLRREGNARTVGGRRQYRACFIPRRANIDAARAAGRQAAQAQREERQTRRKAS
jgi:hypothetical protein